ncbi:hypothetical protein GCM10022253_27850 [Sphingomonas endophytica]|uniref:Uncharacterized protein (TIGR02594 family) n=1 Tax=Sphingomonas endophytica TaxID=869719 RepID=A0ABR6N8F9_9SPHN|nr:TIGR02594 family protein [Sphingomonas endophytica]MBB5727087.1 uncharacterized protein (TIGR02594 family) [Sphingomonas endophytica]
MSTDIVARLQLRADQFSSENARAFADLRQRATSTAQEIRGTWSSALTDVQRLAQSALDVRPTKSGALDLSGEIAQLTAAAQAADRKAAAFRMVEEASQRIAFADGIATEKELQRADAARVSARMEEENAGQIRARIAALKQLQVELDEVAAATGHSIAVGQHASGATAQQRQSMIMLGQQFQDFAVQVGSGQSITTAFAQQIGQAGFALQGMGGRLAGVSAFLTSFGGIATMTAVVALTPLIGKLLDTNDALGDAERKMREDARATEINEQAKKSFARTVEGVTAAVRDQNDELKKSIETQRSTSQQANADANERLARLIKEYGALDRKLTAARAEAARAAAASPQPGTAMISSTAGKEAQRVADLERQMAKLRADGRLATEAVNRTRVALSELDAAASVDPIVRITQHYDEMKRSAQQAAIASGNVTGALTKELAAIERRREAALKAEGDRQAAENRKPGALGAQLAGENGAATLAAARQYLGTRETGAGKATLRELFGTAGISIDPEKVAWCAAFVNAVLAGQGIKGTGSLSARSFLNFGTATNRPLPGDIVVLRRGNGEQGHVGFFEGTDARGRIRVTGGNQGRDGAVTSSSFARDDVLAFRRAPTASRSYAEELRQQKEAAAAAKRTNEQLETSLDQLARHYDPVAAAARVYREELGQIFKLVAAGKLTQGEGFDYAMRARQHAVASRAQGFDQAFRETIGGDAIAEAVEELNSGIMSGADLWAHRLELGAMSAGEALSGAVGSVAEMFGLRISGPLTHLLRPGGIAGQSAETAQLISQALKATGLTLSPASIDKLSGVLAGAAMGQIGGSVFSSITGARQSKVGSAIGGVVGEMAGKAVTGTITKAVGGKLGSLLGNAAGPIGAALGGVLGGVLGSLFMHTPRGAAVITSVNSNAALSGDRQVTDGLSGSARSVQTALRRVADAFGTEVGAFAVSIGKGKNNFRVSSTGSAQVGAKSPRNASIIYDGPDEATAILVATQDAIRDGAIRISKTAQRVLSLGIDLDAALSKAVLIESVPRELKALLDPVGAAVDDLNRKFRKTVAALQEGGASAEEMAQAERLYNLQLQQVKTSTASASASLKTFLTDLKLGSSSPYSYRDQEATALAQLKPYLDQIGAGQRIDQEKYQSAARSYLDVERELYGSTSKYFDAQALIQAATAKAIETIDNAVPIAGGVENPFAKATADSAAKTAANTQTGNELLEQLSDQMGDVRALLERMSARGSGLGDGFIGANRAFVEAA